MAESTSNPPKRRLESLKLGALDVLIREPVYSLAEKLAARLGDNLQSITVVGSSLTRDFRAGHSDINTVVLIREQTLACLNAVASLAKPMSRKRISPPLLMTSPYIERSRDVFGVELLDFQLTHETILGTDPFAALTFEKKNVRLQCERELKATLIRLRQGYIAAAANKTLVRDILISTAKGLTPLLRAMLWLRDIDRPPLSEATFIKAAVELSVNLDPLVIAARWRQERTRAGATAMEYAFASVYAAVEQLAAIVDKFEV